MGALPFESTSIDVRQNLPTKDFLITNYPNPFNNSTSIIIETADASVVDVSVVNILGQKVETLYEGGLEAGRLILNWNAKSSSNELSTGVYFVVVKSDEITRIKKMIMLK